MLVKWKHCIYAGEISAPDRLFQLDTASTRLLSLFCKKKIDVNCFCQLAVESRLSHNIVLKCFVILMVLISQPRLFRPSFHRWMTNVLVERYKLRVETQTEALRCAFRLQKKRDDRKN